MNRLAKRIGELEARAGDIGLAHLKDDDLLGMLRVTLNRMGSELPADARKAYEVQNWSRLIKELEVMQCD